MSTLTPSVVDVLEYQLPENIRSQENALFVKFLKYYYEWLTQQGQPAETIHNLLSYRDIDLASEDFRQHLLGTLLKFVPSTSLVDGTILAKHLTDFLRSKGTRTSFDFIMRAIYGEEIEMEWNSDRLFRPSANEYTRTSMVAVESTTPWSAVEGSEITQTFPYPAIATIESCTTTTFGGKFINWLVLHDKSIVGEFPNGGVVQVLKNTLNRNWYYENEYYSPISLINSTLKIKAFTEENRPYANLLIKQLESNFRAIVDSFIGREQYENFTIVTLTLKTITGTFDPNKEVYIFAPALEAETIIKTDYERGIVSPSVKRIDVLEGGSLYVPGDRLTFIDDTGAGVSAYISDVTPGNITSVNIQRKGYGYSVGDSIIVNNGDSGGEGFSAEVSTIDGIDAQIDLTSELNDLIVIDGGSGYKINDEVEIVGGISSFGAPPARIRIDSVDSTWQFLGVKIEQGGYNYPHYTKLALVDTSTTSIISGFAATPTIKDGQIKSVAVTVVPTISSNTLAIAVNGYGSVITATLSGGAVTGLTISNAGVNYSDPIIEIIGDGKGAFILPSVTSGTITGYNIVSGGTGYTTTTVVVRERNGVGATLTPIFKDQTNSTGVISTFTIIERGSYTVLPPTFQVVPISKVGTGSSATFSLNFRAKEAKIVNSGQYYNATSFTVSGKGAGAILKAYQTGGVVTNVHVISGGAYYYYGTTVSIPGGSSQCSLSPIIVDGTIAGITIISGGTGYTPPEMDGITISSGTAISLSSTISGTGKIVNYQLINGGAGYNSQSEVTPLNISLSGGTGAKFIPTIGTNGVISKIDILDGGVGYSISDTFTVTGGGAGINASLKPVVYNGRVTDVIIENGGTGYQYGTYAIVIGDGSGAAVTPVIETGITQVNVLNGGTLYSSTTTTVIVTDDTGTGAEIRPVVTNGVIVDLEIIKKGSGYTNPTLSLGTPGSGTGAIITGKSERYVTSLTITNAGTNYTYADTFILGEGENADFALVVEKLGTIDTVTISNVGSGYTNTPIVTTSDNSGYGAVSGIKITNFGGGYRKLPVLTLPDKYTLSVLSATGTKFTCFGSSVGGVRNVSFDSHGANYYDLPKPVFGLNALLKENASFKVGERVTIQSGVYREVLTTSYFLMENGDRIVLDDLTSQILTEFGDTIMYEQGGYALLEQDEGIPVIDLLQMDMDDTAVDYGVYATVSNFDYDRNTISLKGLSDVFQVIDELGYSIITENGVSVLDQSSGTFDVGDVIIGEKSKSKATISQLNRSSGQSIRGGNGYTDYIYQNEVGMLNKSSSLIADNNRYQDMAYVVKCGRSLNDYVKTLKDTVHPAGYSLFGDVKTQTYLETNILSEIGYNKLATLLTLYSIVTDGFEGEWSMMDELFGEFTKFNTTVPIDIIKGYLITQTSEYSTGNVLAYCTAPIHSSTMEQWTAINGLQITENYSLAPAGLDTMVRLSDTDQFRTSYIESQITSVVGNTYTLELYIKKQVNPLTYPEIKIGSTYLRFNTETATYVSNASSLDIENVGDYWWVRIYHIASSLSILATVSPSKGFISDLNISANSATGSIRISDIYLRDITGLSPYNILLRARNSNYIPETFRFLATEADITLSAYP